MVDRTVAASMGIAVMLAVAGDLAEAGPPKRSREAILADYRARTDAYYANMRVDAFKLADQGDTTKLAELRDADCFGVGRWTRPLTADLQAREEKRYQETEELCALYDEFFIPKGAPAGLTAQKLLGALGSTTPFPDDDVETYYAQRRSNCGGEGCIGTWVQYCDEGWKQADAAVQQCVGVTCAVIAVRAAQIENSCITPPPALVAEVQRLCAGCTVQIRFTRNSKIMPFVSAVARARLSSTADQVAQCQAMATNTVRCADRSKLSVSFDEYRAGIVKTSSTLGPALSKYFPEADKALRDELVALDNQAASVAIRCAVPTESLVPPTEFYARTGCNDSNVPASKLKPLQVAYEAAWQKQVEQQAEKARADQAAQALEKERSDKATRDRAEAFRRQSEAKLASRECKVAQAWGQYCDTSGWLGKVEDAITHQQRVDAASGTVDAKARRQLAESKLVLEDQLAANAKALSAFKLKPTRRQCQPPTVRSQAVQDACILAPTVEPASSRVSPVAASPAFTISIRDKDGGDFRADLMVDGPGGKRTVTRASDNNDSGFATARFPTDFGVQLAAGQYRWSASVGGSEVVSGSFVVDANKTIHDGGLVWAKRPPKGTWQAAAHPGD